jgi:hypothetical protein
VTLLVSLRPADDDLEAVLGFLEIGHVERHELGPPERASEAQQEERAIAQALEAFRCCQGHGAGYLGQDGRLAGRGGTDGAPDATQGRAHAFRVGRRLELRQAVGVADGGAAAGEPLTKESFGNEFREACRAAGVQGSAHGVRKIAAATAAMNGATTEQLKALFGWTSDAMPALYTRSARPGPHGTRSGAPAFERSANIYSRTRAAGAGARAKNKMISMPNFRIGAVERTRTSTSCPTSTSS